MKNSELLADLEKNGDMTVFAPTNAAFEQLDKNVLEAYIRGENCIDKILQHHILPKVLCSSGVTSVINVVPVNGEKYQITRNADGELFVENAKLISRDIVTKNGVVHVIDKLIMPNAGKCVFRPVSRGRG